MWANGYNMYGNGQQQDMQPNNWMNQNLSNGMNNPFGLRFDNYFANNNNNNANPFAGQMYGNTYQPFSGYGGYQFRQ